MIAYAEARPIDNSIEFAKGISDLLQQFTGKESHLGFFSTLDILFIQESFHLIVALDTKKSNQVVGMVSLFIVPTLTARKGYIEDVVVDTAHQGQGIGKKLMQHAIHVFEGIVQKIPDVRTPQVLASKETYVVTLRYPEELAPLAIASLITLHTLTGRRAYIEDLVIRPEYISENQTLFNTLSRQAGLGSSVESGHVECRLPEIYTSYPLVASVFEMLQFEKRETNLYRFLLPSIAYASLELTSRPTRVEANALYQKLGFQKVENPVYRLLLS